MEVKRKIASSDIFKIKKENSQHVRCSMQREKRYQHEEANEGLRWREMWSGTIYLLCIQISKTDCFLRYRMLYDFQLGGPLKLISKERNTAYKRNLLMA